MLLIIPMLLFPPYIPLANHAPHAPKVAAHAAPDAAAHAANHAAAHAALHNPHPSHNALQAPHFPHAPLFLLTVHVMLPSFSSCS